MNEKQSLDEVHVDELLAQVLAAGCTQLHLEPGRPPYARRDGDEDLHELDYEEVQGQHAQSMVYDIISDEQMKSRSRASSKELRLAFGHRMLIPSGSARFIMLVARDYKGNVTASFRAVSHS